VTHDPARYGVDGSGTIVTRPLDGLTLIYHRPSGITHIADSPLPEILQALERAPGTAAEVLTRLSEGHEIGDDEDALEGLETHLATLVSLGLVRIVR